MNKTLAKRLPFHQLNSLWAGDVCTTALRNELCAETWEEYRKVCTPTLLKSLMDHASTSEKHGETVVPLWVLTSFTPLKRQFYDLDSCGDLSALHPGLYCYTLGRELSIDSIPSDSALRRAYGNITVYGELNAPEGLLDFEGPIPARIIYKYLNRDSSRPFRFENGQSLIRQQVLPVKSIDLPTEYLRGTFLSLAAARNHLNEILAENAVYSVIRGYDPLDGIMEKLRERTGLDIKISTLSRVRPAKKFQSGTALPEPPYLPQDTFLLDIKALSKEFKRHLQTMLANEAARICRYKKLLEDDYREAVNCVETLGGSD